MKKKLLPYLSLGVWTLLTTLGVLISATRPGSLQEATISYYVVGADQCPPAWRAQIEAAEAKGVKVVLIGKKAWPGKTAHVPTGNSPLTAGVLVDSAVWHPIPASW